jgi:hypothetical protein
VEFNVRGLEKVKSKILQHQDYPTVKIDEQNFNSEFVRVKIQSLIHRIILKPVSSKSERELGEFKSNLADEPKKYHRRTHTDVIKQKGLDVIKEFNLLIS